MVVSLRTDRRRGARRARAPVLNKRAHKIGVGATLKVTRLLSLIVQWFGSLALKYFLRAPEVVFTSPE